MLFKRDRCNVTTDLVVADQLLARLTRELMAIVAFQGDKRIIGLSSAIDVLSISLALVGFKHRDREATFGTRVNLPGPHVLCMVKLDASGIVFCQPRERSVAFNGKLGHIGTNLDRYSGLTSLWQIAVALRALPTGDIHHVIVAAQMVRMAAAAMLINRSRLWLHRTAEVVINSVALLTCFFKPIQTF